VSADATASGPSVQPRPEGPIAHDYHGRAGVPRENRRNRVDQHVDALLLHQPADEADDPVGIAASERRAQLRATGRIDAIGPQPVGDRYDRRFGRPLDLVDEARQRL
jgi:hypothetical protein